MKKHLALLIALALVFAAFIGDAGAEEDTLFTDRDLAQEADLTGAESIQLSGQSVTVDHAGVFVLSGEIENGQITVEAGNEDKVQLVLSGVTIHQETGAAIQVKSADKVFITLAQGSENTLSAENITEDGVDGVIFAKTDLTLGGPGKLTILSQQGHGIVCKDTLAITGGNYDIQAAGHGISGKDGLNIASGTFAITTGGGSSAAQMKAADDAGMGRGPWQGSGQTEDESVKAKGLKSDGPINVLFGIFTLDCADDALHAGGNVSIRGGSWVIQSADDGIHSDMDVTISGGSFEIPYCYEGIEGKNVTINCDRLSITSTDDGINAAGEDADFRIPGMDNGAIITVEGGDITIVSDGDCLDSNGSILLNGGELDLTCNGNGNTALDSESGVTNNGAQVTTNDGSENGGGFSRGQMGGGRGQFPGGGKEGGRFPDNGQFPGNGQFPDNGQFPEQK